MSLAVRYWPALLMGLALALTGCAKTPVSQPYPPLPTAPYPAPPDRARTPAPPAPSAPGAPSASAPVAPAPAKPTPRAMASLNLGEEGRKLYMAGRLDAAISTLERASSLNPMNGQNYYWLAEAWLQKGDRGQALQYHRQALRHLVGDPGWRLRLEEQQRRLAGG